MGAVGVDLASRVGGVVELKVILVVSKVLGLLHLHPHQRLTADHVGNYCTTNVFRQVNRRGSSFALLEQQEVKLPAIAGLCQHRNCTFSDSFTESTDSTDSWQTNLPKSGTIVPNTQVEEKCRTVAKTTKGIIVQIYQDF